MKIGYPCINWSIGCKGDRTFRLRNYSEDRLISTVRNNLDCLLKMLRFNVTHDILFFRITSDLIPFASHPVCEFHWQGYFRKELEEIGGFIQGNRIRISMHPDQFVLINAEDNGIVERSIEELQYHAEVLDLMRLDETAKIQIHIGGVYKDKGKSMKRFIATYEGLDEVIARRLVIENDDTRYTAQDCLRLSADTGIPVLFDTFHHQLNGSGEGVPEILAPISSTWRDTDGLPMVDYSTQNRNNRKGRHAESIDSEEFAEFLKATKPFDFDIMLEIKDKERSASKAIELASRDARFITASKAHA